MNRTPENSAPGGGDPPGALGRTTTGPRGERRADAAEPTAAARLDQAPGAVEYEGGVADDADEARAQDADLDAGADYLAASEAVVAARALLSEGIAAGEAGDAQDELLGARWRDRLACIARHADTAERFVREVVRHLDDDAAARLASAIPAFARVDLGAMHGQVYAEVRPAVEREVAAAVAARVAALEQRERGIEAEVEARVEPRALALAGPMADALVEGQIAAGELRRVRPAEVGPDPIVPVNILQGIAAPPLSPAHVPDALGVYADLFARASGFDPTMTLLYAVTGAAAMLHDGVRLLLPGSSSWFESARLWALVVGSPGTGKSPAERAMLRPLRDLHHALNVEWEAANPPGGEPRPDAPPRPRLFVNDATVEALVDVLRANPRGLLIVNDEFESWLGQHDAYRGAAGSHDRGEYLRLYDGGPNQVERVRRGSMRVANWGASIISATTPASLRKLARALPNDGLIQRFIVVSARRKAQPDRTIERLQVEAAADAYAATLRAIYARPGSGVVKLSRAAREAFEAECGSVDRLVEAAGATSEPLAAHFSKHGAMLARLALTFHAATWSADLDGSLVAGDTMQRAVAFLRCCRRHAVAVYADHLGAADTTLDLARAFARSILAHGLPDFNRRELAARCRAFRGAGEEAGLAALQALADLGWIVGRSGDPAGHGTRWTVNSAVHSMFAREAEEARARVRDLREAFAAGSDASS